MTVSHGEEGGLSLHALRLWQLEPPTSELDADPQRAPDGIPGGCNQKLTSAQANMEVVLGCKLNLLEFHNFLHSFGIFASQVIPTLLYRALVMCFYYITDQVRVDLSLISTANLFATTKQCHCCVLCLNHAINLSRFM